MVREIRYDDLSTSLKIAMIGGYVAIVSFIIGFFVGLM